MSESPTPDKPASTDPASEDEGWREARVPLKFAGSRLDVFLATHFERWSRKQIKKVIQAGQVKVNGKRGKAGQTLQTGDMLRIPVMHKAVAAIEDAKEAARQAVHVDAEVRTLYRDDALLIIDKPAGLPVHGGAGIIDRTLIDELREDVLAGYGLVHRLDRHTSGCVALVRGEEARRTMMEAFRDASPNVRKVYEAVVSGVPEEAQGTIDLPLAPPGHGGKARVDEVHGKPARTHWRVLERLPRAARLEVTLETGRTHQIRAHLAAIGHPLVVDPLYAFRKGWTIPDPRGIRHARLTRTPLHARELTVPHPETSQPVTARAPVPADIKYALELLRIAQARGRTRGGLPPPSSLDA